MSKTTNKFSPEVKARAVRMVQEHAADYPTRWLAVVSIAEKIGCAPQTQKAIRARVGQAC
jgi:transposase